MSTLSETLSVFTVQCGKYIKRKCFKVSFFSAEDGALHCCGCVMAFPLQQRCVWWTVAPTGRASVACVTARRAGQDQSASRETVTHAALTTVSAERASATATKVGPANTARSVSCDAARTHALDSRT